MAQIWNPITGKWEGKVGQELDSIDYQNFKSLRPEQQQQMGSAGVMFDKSGNIGLGKIDSEPSMWDTFSGYFNPNEKGVSQAGSVMDTIGSGIKGAVGLGSLYFANKNYDLEKDQQEYLKNIDKQNAARASKFAANAGNNASY